jgi:Holliday junction resolvase-like predicted endonuclease
MAKTPKRQTGDLGEDVACRYLEGRGYTLVERNYLKPWGEIDIVAEKAKKLYFVEVKTISRELSSGGGRGVTREPGFRPEENMHPAKLKRLHRAVQTYLVDHRVPDSVEWQIDLVCVYLDFATRKARVEILENVIL